MTAYETVRVEVRRGPYGYHVESVAAAADGHVERDAYARPTLAQADDVARQLLLARRRDAAQGIAVHEDRVIACFHAGARGWQPRLDTVGPARRLRNYVDGKRSPGIVQWFKDLLAPKAEYVRTPKGTPDTSTETNIVVMGDEVSFLEHKTEKEIVCGEEFVIVHDVSGTQLRVCDFYVVRKHGLHRGRSEGTDAAITNATKWHGDAVRLERYVVDLPNESWQRVAKVDAIRYRRHGVLRGPYEHAYDPAVVLYRHATPLAWRIALPNGCIVDERGFVWP